MVDKVLLAMSNGSTVTIYDTAGDDLTTTTGSFSAVGNVINLAWSPDNSTLYYFDNGAGADPAGVYQVGVTSNGVPDASGTLVFATGYTLSTTSVSHHMVLSGDGTKIAIASQFTTETLEVWDVASGTRDAVLNTPHLNVAINSDGTRIASVEDFSGLVLYDGNLTELDRDAGTGWEGGAFATDDLLYAFVDQEIALFDISSDTLVELDRITSVTDIGLDGTRNGAVGLVGGLPVLYSWHGEAYTTDGSDLTFYTYGSTTAKGSSNPSRVSALLSRYVYATQATAPARIYLFGFDGSAVTLLDELTSQEAYAVAFSNSSDEPTTTPDITPESRFGDGTNWALFKSFDETIGDSGGWESFTNLEATPADADTVDSFEVELYFNDGNLALWSGLTTIGRVRGTLEVDYYENTYPVLPGPLRAISGGEVEIKDADGNIAIKSGSAISDLFASSADQGAAGTFTLPFSIDFSGLGLTNVPSWLKFRLTSGPTNPATVTPFIEFESYSADTASIWTDETDDDGQLGSADPESTGSDTDWAPADPNSTLVRAYQTFTIPIGLRTLVDTGQAELTSSVLCSSWASDGTVQTYVRFFDVDGVQIGSELRSLVYAYSGARNYTLHVPPIPVGARTFDFGIEFADGGTAGDNQATISYYELAIYQDESPTIIDAIRVRITDFKVDDPDVPDPPDPGPDPDTDPDAEIEILLGMAENDTTEPKITALQDDSDVFFNANTMVRNLADFADEFSVDAIIPLGERDRYTTIDNDGKLRYYWVESDNPGGFRDGRVGILTRFSARSALPHVPVTLTFRGRENRGDVERPTALAPPTTTTPTTPDPISLSSIDVSSGNADGGTEVVLSLTNFDPGAPFTVKFGDETATATRVTASTVTVNSPLGVPGESVAVSITQNSVTSSISGAFTYDAIDLVSISPTSGAEAGGDAGTATGTGFMTDGSITTTVTFGGVDATSVVTVSDTEITYVSPAGTGVVDVVITQNGASDTLAGGYTYV